MSTPDFAESMSSVARTTIRVPSTCSIDLVEFHVDHFRRQFEVMLLIEGVEEVTLRLGAGCVIQLLLKLRFQHGLQLFERVDAEAFGELFVDVRLLRRANFVDLHFEDSRFAGEVLGLVLFREGDFDVFFFAGFRADQLFLETRDEAAGAENQRVAFSGAAFERLAVNLANEVDDDSVAVFRLCGLAARLELHVVFGDLVERFVKLRIVDFSDWLLDGDAGHVCWLKVRHDVDMHVVSEVFFALDRSTARRVMKKPALRDLWLA